MKPIYRVSVVHTKEMLKNFIKFTYRMNSPRAAFKLCMFAICFFLLAYAFRGGVAMYACGILGVLVVVFTFTRKYIAFHKLAKSDLNYQKKQEIEFEFGQKELIINSGEDVVSQVKYNEITDIYEDDLYLYILIKNQELQMLSKSEEIFEKRREFQRFLEGRIKKPILPTKKPIKVRIAEIREEQAKTEAIKEKAWEERKARKREEKRNK